MGPTRILLVDDHVLFRKGMARLIDSQPDFEVVAEAEDGYQAVEWAYAATEAVKNQKIVYMD